MIEIDEAALDLAALPAQLRKLVRTLGARLALALLEEHGGANLQLRVLANGRAAVNYEGVSRLLGPDGVRALVEAFPGQAQLTLPMPDKLHNQVRDADIARRVAAGEPLREIARSYRLTVRQVMRIAERGPAKPGQGFRDERQQDLFLGPLTSV